MSRTRLLLVFIATLSCFPIAASCASPASTAGTPSTVVARQGDATITLADVDAFAQRIPEPQRPGFFDSPKRIESLITSMLLEKQLAAEARAAGLDKDPEVKRQIDIAVEETLSRVRLDNLKADLKLPDFGELAKEEYLGHKDKYVVPGVLDVKQVLISTKSHSESEAKKIADDVEKEAKAHPDQFDALVEKYSDDPTKATNQGLITDAGSDRYVPAFADAAKALRKPGEISPVVQSPYGFHVLKLIRRTAEKQEKFADVREKIVADLRSQFINDALKQHTDAIRNRPMDANPDLVASLRTRYGTAPDLSPSANSSPAGH